MARDEVQRFIGARDLTVLEGRPLVFEKNSAFKSYLCCNGQIANLATWCIPACFCPVGTFCPGRLYEHFSLQLGADSLKYSTATNDCCCHIAYEQKTVPLDKIQDVELQTDCLLSCFDLKKIAVQTAGQGGPGAEVQAAFLTAPEEVRDAIQLAVKCHREAPTTAPQQQAGMLRGPAAAKNMLQRLQGLDQLVKRGVLTHEEAGRLRTPVLVADSDPTQRLVEVAELADTQVISREEFGEVKAALLAQIMRA
ncbi:hypothetical protein KFL_004700030 [Klebsormidium nitens]|uniref:YdbS-like PH domain-containing protein n=1 Tax=Klebsormidium nitens TaxID=105231 RepID=A0A1Y1IIK4_KLENI|nr:hypothetical protein KFL_004700030 [Klebsormidium nitens]|eukprot:GAQ88921.1 hypothetical protein KFL_004700030 [Klebsormidium nitens]